MPCFHASRLWWMGPFVCLLWEHCHDQNTLQCNKYVLYPCYYCSLTFRPYREQWHVFMQVGCHEWILCIFWSLHSALEAKYVFMDVNNRRNCSLQKESASLTKDVYMHANNRWKDRFGALCLVRQTGGMYCVQSGAELLVSRAPESVMGRLTSGCLDLRLDAHQ